MGISDFFAYSVSAFCVTKFVRSTTGITGKSDFLAYSVKSTSGTTGNADCSKSSIVGNSNSLSDIAPTKPLFVNLATSLP